MIMILSIFLILQEGDDYEKLFNNSEYTNLLSQLIYVAGNYENISQNTIIEINKLLKEIESEIEK